MFGLTVFVLSHTVAKHKNRIRCTEPERKKEKESVSSRRVKSVLFRKRIRDPTFAHLSYAEPYLCISPFPLLSPYSSTTLFSTVLFFNVSSSSVLGFNLELHPQRRAGHRTSLVHTTRHWCHPSRWHTQQEPAPWSSPSFHYEK